MDDKISQLRLISAVTGPDDFADRTMLLHTRDRATVN